MKYIKKFETIINGYKGEFWLVRTDSPYYEVSLDKVGLSNEIKLYTTYNYFKRKGLKKIYVAKPFNSDILEWIPFRRKKFFIDQKYEYKGEIKPTEEEIKNFLIRKEAEKYNI